VNGGKKVKLSELLNVIEPLRIEGHLKDLDINGICYDPLRVAKNFIYVAINIYTQLDKIEIPDGHPFVEDAVERGAVCVIVERDVPCPEHVLKIVVADSRYALSALADKFYGTPSQEMQIFGVTGTNGKTTTTHIIEKIFEPQQRVGLIGSLYYKINGDIFYGKDTTPEPPDLQMIFQRMRDAGCTCCTMEVSSHAMEFHRVDHVDFSAAVFTNLTPDHLDFHKTMENYREAKLKLFRRLKPMAHAIINIDDPNAPAFIEASNAPVITTGLQHHADIYATNIVFDVTHTDYRIHTPKGSFNVRSPLIGKFNIYNTLSAVGVAIAKNVSLEIIQQSLEKPLRILGRFEKIERGQPFAVIVDYAHTPDGMHSVLYAAKQLEPNRLITVFGCGGNRDRTKRPLMGEAACKYSDFVILTTDNPRFEAPEAIIRDIEAGMSGTKYEVILNRKEAIYRAVATAQPGDIVMILGKGHEKYQEIQGKTHPFYDVEVAENALEEVLNISK
jgi:UDP-N-acetylmuramoyl-L-alanyl-D-glutamate--2,6-diaminopimelate ligase